VAERTSLIEPITDLILSRSLALQRRLRLYEPVIGRDGPIGAIALAGHEPVARLDPPTRTASALLAAQASLAFGPVGGPLRVPEAWGVTAPRGSG
jgi:hypothetical protein